MTHTCLGLIPFLFVLCIGFTGCRSTIELVSVQAVGNIQIDGSPVEWEGRLTRFKSPAVSMGVRNTEEHLFLCLTTADPAIQTQILFAGLTVRFESSGEMVPFAIQYPLRQDQPVRPRAPGEGLEVIFGAFAPHLHTLQIVRESDRQMFSVLDVPGIQVRIGMANSVLTYELQVPLIQAPYYAVPSPDGILTVTFETTSVDRFLPGAGSSRPEGRKRERSTSSSAADLPVKGDPFRFVVNVVLFSK
ncbi:MAG: hypothetical protein HY563_01090 [Ignavibacteriales bacterium]|nr:hypothetical protein [Ignavibacteriales bacterium]